MTINLLHLIFFNINVCLFISMGIKKNKSAEEMQNWYQDRYMSVAIQRNFLLLFSVFIAGALLICLIVVKRLQEGSSSEPYFIEYDKKSGLMTIVETQSKKVYTAQQAVKESMLLQYINRREAPQLATLEDDMNYVRVSTAAKIYGAYLNEVGAKIKELRSAGSNAKYETHVKALQYLAANRVQVTITKNILVNGNIASTMDYRIIATFGFADIEMPIDDMRVNPLGFQVSYYKAIPVKTFTSTLMGKAEDKENGSEESSDGRDNS